MEPEFEPNVWLEANRCSVWTAIPHSESISQRSIKKRGDIELRVVSDSTSSKPVGLPINKVTITNPLNLPTNQKFSLDVTFKFSAGQHSKWSMKTDSTHYFIDEDSEHLPRVTQTSCQGQDWFSDNAFLNILGGRTEAETDISCKSLNHFNKVYPDIMIPTFQIKKKKNKNWGP